MILREILGLQPLDFKWLTPNVRATFNDGKRTIGVLIDELSLDLPSRTLSLVNVSFGTIDGKTFQSEDDLDTSLTGTGAARTVFATVAAICKASKTLQDADLICLGGADEHRERRAVLYSIAWSEVKQHLPKFQDVKPQRITTATGAILLVLSSVQLDLEERNIVLNSLNLVKS